MDRSVTSIARDWIGTPYMHQQSVKGVAADCLGLIRGIWRERYGQEPAVPPPYTPDWGEFGPDEPLMRGACRHLIRLSEDAAFEDGQVLLFRMRAGAVAKHLGILAQAVPAWRFIHAYTHHGVIDSPLTTPWQTRIAARFRFP